MSRETKNSLEAPPLRPVLTELHPHGVVNDYYHIEETKGYRVDNGKNSWKGIVTEFLPGDEDGARMVFSLAGGLARNHPEIRDAIGLKSEKTYRLKDATAFLRLESEEESGELLAEICYLNGSPSLTDLDVAASLLQAANQLTPPFGQPHERFRIKTFSKGQTFIWNVESDDFTGQPTAYPVVV